MRDVLLLFSGGRDSFLSACRLIEEGYRVRLVSYNNGCMSNLGSIEKTANRICAKYKEYGVKYEGCFGVQEIISSINEEFMNNHLEDIARDYPLLRPYQLNCLICHTAMFIKSIKLCKDKGILFIADGSRESQRFIIELPKIINLYMSTSKKYGIDLLYPVYDLVDDWERKLELSERGFVPKVDEAQCWKGIPMGNDLSDKEIDCYAQFLSDNIFSLVSRYL